LKGKKGLFLKKMDTAGLKAKQKRSQDSVQATRTVRQILTFKTRGGRIRKKVEKEIKREENEKTSQHA